MARLAIFPKLNQLTLENTSITDNGLQVIRKLPEIKSLNLRRTSQMTDAGLAVVKDLPQLQYLSLLYNNIGNRGHDGIERS